MECNITKNFSLIPDMCPHRIETPEWFLCVYTLFAENTMTFDRIVSPLWYSIGIPGNIVTFHVLRRLKGKHISTPSLYLQIVAVTDTLLLILHILLDLQFAWGKPTLEIPIWCTIFFVIFYFAQYMSPLLVFGFSCERYVSIAKPFKSTRFGRSTRIRKEIVLITVIAFLVSLGQIAGWTYDNGKFIPINKDLYGSWSYISEIIIFIIVPFMTLICNIFVIRATKKAILKRNSAYQYRNSTNARKLHAKVSATRMLLVISFYRISVTLSTSIIYMLQYHLFPPGNPCMSTADMTEDDVWQKHFLWHIFKKIIDEFGLSQYAVNIIFCFVKVKQFRVELIKFISFTNCRSQTQRPIGNSVR